MHKSLEGSTDLNARRLAELDVLLTEISKADMEALTQLRQFLLDAMFPSMPDAARAIVQPLFALITLEVTATDQVRSRLSDLVT